MTNLSNIKKKFKPAKSTLIFIFQLAFRFQLALGGLGGLGGGRGGGELIHRPRQLYLFTTEILHK